MNDVDSSSPSRTAIAHFKERGKVSPCLWLSYWLPETSTGYSAGTLDCLLYCKLELYPYIQNYSSNIFDLTHFFF